ncbi:hypothetical protein FOS14_01470 [Skermania sp. ID1734]|uniref:hypothetical protein n=1 Tax=Skermania sp. ID1734 TaxID=2597516 RepID=UPI00117EF6A0|nr:hypothetical protein [Skermania sp. ID1734]TSE02080.1 hypothetical protein FOS14_01470 [Skermania sp. ID1734]
MRDVDSAILLEAAAFGARPGLSMLPQPVTADQSWLRAVALGGQGRYARARAELARAEALARQLLPAPRAVSQSLILSTRASFLRQLGWHRKASAFDGAALAALADSAADGVAACDALTGLAADALGVGRLPLATRLLDRCGEELEQASLGWRQRIRLHWVRAEVALASGCAHAGLDHALAAAEFAAMAPSLRHRIKSQLLVAGAYCAVGEQHSAREQALAVAAACDEHDLLPLRWAAAMLLDGLAAATVSPGERDTPRTAPHYEMSITQRGGIFRQ